MTPRRRPRPGRSWDGRSLLAAVTLAVLAGGCAPAPATEAAGDPRDGVAARVHLAGLAAADPRLARLADEVDAGGRAVVVLRLEGGPLGPLGSARLAAVAARLDAFVATLDGVHVRPRRRFLTFPALVADVDAVGLATLAADPRIRALHGDPPAVATLAEAVPLIGADVAVAAGRDGAAIGVAVIDSGVSATHDDLAGVVLQPGQHFLDQGADVGSGGADDDNGHGTHVAGVIASQGQITAQGTAPGARILPIKVLDAEGRGYTSDWALALDWLAAHKDDHAVPIRVANLSLTSFDLSSACPCDDDPGGATFAEAARVALDAGILVVGASGNAGDTARLPYPACFSAVLAVGATYDASFGPAPPSGTYATYFMGAGYPDCADTSAARALTCFTNRNACVPLVAPGAAILGPASGTSDATRTYYGTSQAAPFVAGVAAGVLSAFPGLDLARLRDAIVSEYAPRVSDPAVAGRSFAFLDAVIAGEQAECLAACPAGPCLQAGCTAAGECVSEQLPPGSACGEPVCAGGEMTVPSCDASGGCAPEVESCQGFRCDPEGHECLTSCLGDSDCLPGYACAPGGRCEDVTTDVVGTCACRVGAGADGRTGLPAVLLAALAALAGRRRRRGRHYEPSRISSLR